MKIFITGITGFVGSSLAQHLAGSGYDVTGMGRQQSLPSHINIACKYIRGDIRQPLPAIEADVVIHAAALASDTAVYKDLYLTNVEGTRHVLHAASQSASFIYISSSSVYSFASPVMTESEGGQDLNHLSGYGKTKFLAEELVRDNTSIPSKYILRPRAIYGVYDKVLLPRLLKLVRGKQLLVPAHLAQHISLTHINNLVDIITGTMLHNKTEMTATYNIADGKIYNLVEVLPALLSSVTGKRLKMKKIPTWLWEGAVALNEKFGWPSSLNRFAADSLTKNAVLNLEAATKDLSYQPQNTFEDSCEEIARWVTTQGGWKNYKKQI